MRSPVTVFVAPGPEVTIPFDITDVAEKAEEVGGRLSTAVEIAVLLTILSLLPAVLVDEFTVFNVGDEPFREVLAGEMYAIVVEFISRDTNNDANAIARLLGQTNALGDPYPDGTGSTGESGVGFTANTNDYFFRTFVLQKS